MNPADAGKVFPFTEVELIVPDPDTVSEAPVPTIIAAVVFVPLVMALKAALDPVTQVQVEMLLEGVPHCKSCPPDGLVEGNCKAYAVKEAELGPSKPTVFAVIAGAVVLPGKLR